LRRDWPAPLCERQCDAVTVDVVFVDDDVTDVDADAEFDPPIFGDGCVRSAIARWISMAQRTASTALSELDQRTITRGLDDAAAMLRYLGIDKFFFGAPSAPRECLPRHGP